MVGECNATGVCNPVIVPGLNCTPAGTPNQCISNTSGTCTTEGVCDGVNVEDGCSCEPEGGGLECTTYTCFDGMCKGERHALP